jgi:Cu(I)/Ag(I) efflux system periplasmic protein CusF
MHTMKHWIAAAMLAAAGSAQAQAAMTDGEVRKVEGDKLTLKHSEIKNLDMPAMTMVFKVANPASIAKLQPGDKVRFTAEKVGGQYTITKLEAAK